MAQNYVLINEELQPAEDAQIRITDLAVQRGYGIFDFLKTVDGKPVFLDDHLDRFYSSAEQMRLAIAIDRGRLKSLLNELISANNIAESGIRITLTGGYSPDGFNIAEPNLIVQQTPFALNRDFNKTIGIITHEYQRQFSSAKTLDYLQAIWLQPVLRERGADDVLYYSEGKLRECPRANFFLVNANDEILTASERILKGITRKHLLKFSDGRFKVAERDITLEDLASAKEAFISSTTKNILAISSIDGRVLGNGQTGPVTLELARAFDQYVYSKAELVL